MAHVEEDIEKMAKILLIDFDNTMIERLYPEQEAELKVWKDVLKSDENWKKIISLQINDEATRQFFDGLAKEKKKSYFTFGVACIISFLQANFTGPELSKEITSYFEADMFKVPEFNKYLTVNHEQVNVNTKLPCLLAAAKLVFKNCKYNPLINVWWTWRSIIIHQQVLDELSPTLLAEAQKLQFEVASLNLEGHVRAKFEIEQAQLHLMYRSVNKAEHHIETACDILGLKYELNVKLPSIKQDEKNHLALEVTLMEKENIQRPPVNKFPVPMNIALNNDVRLDTVNYLDNRNKDMLFPNTEQKLLLTIVQDMMASKPQHELRYEELKPFLDLILTQNNTWPVRVATLLLRCKLEARQDESLKRCVAQLEEIIKCYRKEEPHPLTRMGGVYGTGLQPIWRTEIQYAQVLYQCDMISKALEIFLRLQVWDQVSMCLVSLKKRQKAAELMKEQYEKKKDPKFLCWLGDVTHDVSCYEKAWQLSKKCSFRAQRHWALNLFNTKFYHASIAHFEKSLSINPLQASLWQKLGFAAMECNEWQVAATAFRRFTTFEPDGFESWNNLAQAYINLGNKRSGHQALVEGLRCNSDNWKVWENLLVVSADISHFADVIKAYHRVLDLRDEDYLNTEVLGVLVYGVCNNVNDVEGRPSMHLLQKTRELLGRVVSVNQTEAKVWELYGDLAPILQLRAQRYMRAYRAYVNVPQWNKTTENCLRVMDVCRKLADLVLKDEVNSKDALVQSVRLILSSVISIVKKLDSKLLKYSLEEATAKLAKVIEKAKNGATKNDMNATV